MHEPVVESLLLISMHGKKFRAWDKVPKSEQLFIAQKLNLRTCSYKSTAFCGSLVPYLWAMRILDLMHRG